MQLASAALITLSLPYSLFESPVEVWSLKLAPRPARPQPVRRSVSGATGGWSLIPPKNEVPTGRQLKAVQVHLKKIRKRVNILN